MTGENLEIIAGNVNEALEDTSSKNFTEKNDEINAASTFAAKKLVLRVSGKGKKRRTMVKKEDNPNSFWDSKMYHDF